MPTVNHDEQKAFWEEVSIRRAPDHPAVLAFAEPKLSFILKHLDMKRSCRMRMLEVGCGNGYFSHTFSKAFDLTCIDFSRNMLEMNPLPWDRKVVGDAENLSFNDDSFDVVFCGNLLHHLQDPSVAVREMKRVARRNVVLIKPNITNPLMFLFCFLKPEERGALKFYARYIEAIGTSVGLRLRAQCAQGSIVPNKTPKSLLALLCAIDWPWPLGFYHIAIFDV